MKKIILAFIIVGLLITSITTLSAETKHTGRLTMISNVAFQGEPEKSYGWPVRVSSIDEAIENARAWGINAFHMYITGSQSAGHMYPFKSLTGYEAREGNHQSIGVLMERTTVHK